MKPDPILEECYRIKEEYSAQFSAHLEIRRKRGEESEGITQILNRFKS